MRNLLAVLLLIIITNALHSATFYDTTVLMEFESVNVKQKSIKFSGREYFYEMIEFPNSFSTIDFRTKNLNRLKKGEKLYVTIRNQYSSDKNSDRLAAKEKIIYIGKNRYGF